MKKMRWGYVLSLLLIFSAAAGFLTSKAAAKELEDPSGIVCEDGILSVENQEALLQKIQEAKDIGVDVTVNESMKAPVYVKDAGAAETAIAEHNQAEIACLDDAIALQEQHNADYTAVLKASFQNMLGAEWSFEDLEKFILTDAELQATEAVKVRKMVEKLSGASVITASDQTQLVDAKCHFANPGFLTINDQLYYENVFQDNRSKSWVDLRLTLCGIGLVHSSDPEKIPLHDIRKNEPWYLYSTDDVTFQVDFLNHETKEPISVLPIIALVDIDEGQAVQLNAPQLNGVLFGSKISPKEGSDGVYISKREGDPTEGRNKAFWTMFSTEETNSFTYTFYAQRQDNNGVIQGIGGDSVNYDKPDTQVTTESVEVTLYRQPITHKVRYLYVGDTPESAVLPQDDTAYGWNQELMVAENPSSIRDERGIWTFRGWYEDEELTRPLAAHPVQKDEILYGAWHLNPFISVVVKKTWVGKEADQAEIRLLANGEKQATAILTAENQWQHTFTQLPMYADDQQPIAYTVKEVALDGYTTEIVGTMQEGFTITNTEKRPIPEPKSEEPKKTEKKSPKTGDVGILMSVAMLVTSVGALYAADKKRKWKSLRQ